MTIYHFYSAAGGQGTTVAACMFALTSKRDTLLVDMAGDVLAATGLPETRDKIDLTPNVQVVVKPKVKPKPSEYQDIVIDWGCRPTVMPDYFPTDSMHTLVTKPCYLALRRQAAYGIQPDNIVLFADSPGRALRDRDVEATVGAPIAYTLHYDDQVARWVDAGLMSKAFNRKYTDFHYRVALATADF